VKYLGVLLNASLKDDDDIQRQVKSIYCACAAACRCMLADHRANTLRQDLPEKSFEAEQNPFWGCRVTKVF